MEKRQSKKANDNKGENGQSKEAKKANLSSKKGQSKIATGKKGKNVNLKGKIGQIRKATGKKGKVKR